MSSVLHYRGQHAALRRHRGPDDPATVQAAEKLRDAQYEQRARDLVATWPEFSEETRSSLRALLRPITSAASLKEAA